MPGRIAPAIQRGGRPLYLGSSARCDAASAYLRMAGEVLFGRLVKGGNVIVDKPEEGGDKLTLRFE